CVVLRSVKHAVNNSRVARGLVHGPNSLNATFIRQGRISVRLRKLARNLRNGHLGLLAKADVVTGGFGHALATGKDPWSEASLGVSTSVRIADGTPNPSSFPDNYAWLSLQVQRTRWRR